MASECKESFNPENMLINKVMCFIIIIPVQIWISPTHPHRKQPPRGSHYIALTTSYMQNHLEPNSSQHGERFPPRFQ